MGTLGFRLSFRRDAQLPPAVQFKLALAGVSIGWKYGLVQAVTPLAEGAEAMALEFDAQVEAIRSSAQARESPGEAGEAAPTGADTAAAAAAVAAAGDGDGRVRDDVKEAVSV